MLDEIGFVSDVLETMPELFPLCADLRLAELGYRKAIVRAYVLVYEIGRNEQVVRVLRFFHSSEDYAEKM